MAFCSTGSCSDRLSYGGVYACAPCSPRKHAVRASGPSRSSSDACSEARDLEPSLLRGKSPVPYLSGVTRIVGRGSERNRTPCVGKTAGLPPAAPHGATDPCGAIGKWPRRRCSAVVKMLVSGLVIRRRMSRLGRCRTPGHRCWRPRRQPLARAQVNTRMTGCASTIRMRSERRSVSYQRTSALPVFPASRPAACRSSSDRPGRHGYAPTLNGAVPRSLVSTMCMRAMDIDSRHSADDVNRLSATLNIR